jgi:homocysteine S-methyltransferase
VKQVRVDNGWARAMMLVADAPAPSMQFEQIVQSRTFALSEGSMYERLRREPGVNFDPHLAHATLIYGARDARVLAQLHREYLDVGQRYSLPMFALTDTWRANGELIMQSRFHGRMVNQDNARFLISLRDSYGDSATAIFIGGLMGPRGDAYVPEQALTSGSAELLHAIQAEALAEGEVDFLYAATVPALSEACGIAAAMERTGLPYVISFVIRRDGTLLDGTTLAEAIQTIDDAAQRPPSGYAVNCVHPSIFCEGMAALRMQGPGLELRILSFQANASAKDPKELDGIEELDAEEAESWAGSMLRAFHRFGTPFCGGCCGTDTSHIEALAKAYSSATPPRDHTWTLRDLSSRPAITPEVWATAARIT